MVKIALAMIIKDSEPKEFVTRCLDTSAPFVDGVFLTLNGKSDKPTKESKELKKYLEEYAAKFNIPFEIDYIKWNGDFSEARNHNFSRVPKRFHYILWLDSDDIFRGGDKIREVATDALNKGFGAVFFNYLYRVEVKDNKIVNVLIEHLRERLVKNDGSYKWVSPIHETLIPQREVVQTDSQLCDVVHLSNDDRAVSAMNRNAEILEKQLASQGTNQDPRTIYYLAKVYFDYRTPEYWDKAEELIKKYLFGSDTNGPSGWAEERAQAYEYLAEIYRDRGLFNKAIKCVANALIEDPKFPNFYIDMALIYMYQKDWSKAKHWAELSQSVPYPKTTLVSNPKDMQVRVMEVLFNVAINTNDLETATILANKIADMFPDNEEVRQRAYGLNVLKVNNEIAHKVIDLARFLYDGKQMVKLENLVRAIPEQLEEEPVMQSLIRDFTPSRKWAEDEVVILCGRGFEKWSPKNLDSGIGGSEEAVIYLSRELSKLGWRVTVYGDPQDDSGVYDGVTYLPYFKFNPKDDFNILIGWRSVQVFDERFKKKKAFLWLHDIQNPLEYTQIRTDRIDRIFALSEWHRNNMPNVPDDKFMITGNGINIDHILSVEAENIHRDPHRMVYTSSYDRGLEHLLKMWPDIIKEVPDATLRICYGWNLFETFYKNNPERMAWKAKMDELMTQPGITNLGRIGQVDVLREMFAAGVWAYPTHFGEISCITAMKAQACGAIPVVCSYAALKETVQHGVKINVDESDIYDPSIRREFKNQLVKVLKLGRSQDDVRTPMMGWARTRFSWDRVAAQWDSEFKRNDLLEAAAMLVEHNPSLRDVLPVGIQEDMGYEQTF